MTPLRQHDRIKERTATLGGNEAFANVERALGEADALFLNRGNGEQLVLLPLRFWNRLMANVAASWGSMPDFSDLSKGTR